MSASPAASLNPSGDTLTVKDAGNGKSVVEWKARFKRLAYWTDDPPPGTSSALLRPWVIGLGAVGATIRFLEMRRLRREMRKLEQRQALEQERVRISSDLHDELVRLLGGPKAVGLTFPSNRARAFLMSTDAGGVLVIKLNDLSAYTVITTGVIVPSSA